MKRYGYLYEKIYTKENIKLAHKKAKRGKSKYKEVRIVNKNQGLLDIICDDIQFQQYRTSPYHIEKINDRGKERIIFKLPYYPDRIVQWAIMLQIEDIFTKSFIYDTYASIPNRGIHRAVKRVNKSICNGGKYCLKFDVRKYFPSISQQVLMCLLEKKIKDSKLLWMLEEIISSIPQGIPIGNYLSQWFANYYLSFFDHLVCEKYQLPYYRYMDDIVVLSQSKTKLWDCLSFCHKQLEKLKLTIKDNYQIFPSRIRGIDFLGYRSFGKYVLLRKRIANNIKIKSKIISSKTAVTHNDISKMISYKGWLEHCNGYKFTNKYILTNEVST